MTTVGPGLQTAGRAERMSPAVSGWSDITSAMAARVWEAVGEPPGFRVSLVPGTGSSGQFPEWGTGRFSAPVQAPICNRLR